MDDQRKAVPHYIDVDCNYDRDMYKHIMKERWDIYNDEPIADAGGLCRVIRHLTNSDESRIRRTNELVARRHKVIIFYNFDYELDMLRTMCVDNGYTYAEWNGHKHEPIPSGDSWVYLVQYTAGAEGWNCIKTDTIIFFSQNYSYKIMAQAAGRINRMNTPFKDLYYYTLISKSQLTLLYQKPLSKEDIQRINVYSCY